ncbi:MAG: peptidase M23 [Gammaproteobacteria bacterium]|nr:MAG: peptidase M23 [Gammaproteobacteria bacterium]
MKYNKRLKPASESRIFSRLPFGKKNRLRIGLSLIGITGVFITGIVLATSRPYNVSIQSNIIDLPNLPASIQLQQNPSKTSLIAPLPVSAKKVLTDTKSISSTTTDINKNSEPAIDELLVAETIAAENQNNKAADLGNKPELTSNLSWEEITVKSGDNLSLLFPRVGLTARDVHEIAQLKSAIKPLLNLKPGQTLRFGFATSGEDKKVLDTLILKLNQISHLEINSIDGNFAANLVTQPIETRQAYTSGVIENSLFFDASEAGLSDKLIMELAYIFGWDIDFALNIRKNDTFSLVYEEEYLDDDKFRDGKILAAEFINQGKRFRAVRYTYDKGNSHYYTPTGNSMRKTFTRTPVHFSRISSKFNPNRKHPVLKTSRPHKGVDYAAARGTPILATGDGKVVHVGRKGGYGRAVILQHGEKYTTLYAHMSRYRKGLKRGQRVKQGQTIGYIGSSGLATGPHLHYEFRVNGVHRNPLTVALPKAESLNKKYRADFEQKIQPLLAQLDTLDKTTTIALNE